MSAKTKQINSRNYLWDNMKAFLILTVVLGHFLEKVFPMESGWAKALDYWIYTFHMPAFLFVSGYWSKGYCKNSRVRINKVCYFIGYYAIFQILFYLLSSVFSPDKRFTFFVPEIGLWYLLAMAVYYLIIPMMEKIPSYFGMPVLFVLALLIGTESKAGSFLTISRIFVFAPLFFLGYYTSEKFINKLRNLKLSILLGIFATISSVGIWSIILYKNSELLPIQIFFGKASYKSLGISTLHGMGIRAITWVIGILMIISLITLVTEKKTPFSYVGQRSLQIYLFHFFLIIILDKTTFTNNFPIENLFHCLVVVLISAIFTLILSVKPLSYPFNWIQKLVDKILIDIKKGTKK